MLRPSENEDGAVAVMVAMFVAAIVLALAALTIDGGSLWQSQRSMVTDTDAAALAGAQLIASMTRSQCQAEATAAASGTGYVYEEVEEVLHANTPNDELSQVRIACDQEAGKVLVAGRQPSSSAFAPTNDGEDLNAAGRSIAEFGRTPFPPFAVCVDLVTDDEGDPLGAGEHTFRYKKPDGDSDCRDILGEETSSDNYAPANWGWIDEDDLFDGDELSIIACKDDPWCDGDSGTSPANKYFSDLQSSGNLFRFAVFDFTRNPHQEEKTASGTNTQFRIMGYAESRLIACADKEEDLTPTKSKCQGNRNYLKVDIDSVTLFAEDETVRLPSPPLSLCGERTSDRCRNGDW